MNRYLLESDVIKAVDEHTQDTESGLLLTDDITCILENIKTHNENKLQCAACGFIGEDKEFYNSAVHNKFKICPKCGTVRFVCDDNREYRK